MGIIRVKKDSNYSVINNTGLKDERLSWKAKGILAYALTLPDDWTFHISELARHAKDGEDSLRTAFSLAWLMLVAPGMATTVSPRERITQLKATSGSEQSCF